MLWVAISLITTLIEIVICFYYTTLKRLFNISIFRAFDFAEIESCILSIFNALVKIIYTSIIHINTIFYITLIKPVGRIYSFYKYFLREFFMFTVCLIS